MTQSCDIGLIGLAVMGENLALNIESRGYKVAVYNRTTSVTDDFMKGRAAGKRRRVQGGRPAGRAEADKGETVRRDRPKVGRNDPCPCGSGKKYKKCHGKDEAEAAAES